MKRNKYQPKWISAAMLAAALVSGCDIGVEDPDGDSGNSTSNTQTTPPTNTPPSTNDGASTGDGTSTGGGTSTPVATGGDFNLSLANQTVNLTEGSNVSVTVRLQRNNGYTGQVSVAAAPAAQGDAAQLGWTFTNTRIADNENSTSINISLDYAVLPIQPQVRTLRITATDGNTQRDTLLDINVTPTDLPDVYLLIGQSNMVGSSEANAKQADFAGDDAPAPDGSIQQLNVTGNDQENFRTEASFTDDNAIAVSSPRFTPAVDPLHDGFDSSINGKAGTQIGLGLSFAKRAIQNTSASRIYLVPAAWADTGFCRRDRQQTALEMFEGSLGWNAKKSIPEDPQLSGTLLHDRAKARTDMTLRETNGILRGILWHQGEADASNPYCAQLYQQNITDMVASLRSEIIEDARGPDARGPNANVPFIVGTMSKGSPYDFQPDPKIMVDDVHRNIIRYVPFSAVVDNDQFIPPAYPCGNGDCIHFGSRAYRQMGSEYYDQLLQAAIGQ